MVSYSHFCHLHFQQEIKLWSSAQAKIHLAMTFKDVWFTHIHNWLFNPLKYLSVEFPCRLLAGNTCFYCLYAPFMFPKYYFRQGLICFCIFPARVLVFCRNFLFCFLSRYFWGWCISSSWSQFSLYYHKLFIEPRAWFTTIFRDSNLDFFLFVAPKSS